MMFQSTPYAAATPFTLLNAVPCVETAPYAPDVRLMMLSAVAVPKTIAWSPDVFLYATARSVTAAPAVTTATSAAYVAPLSVLSRILMPVPAASVYTTITRAPFAAHATFVPMPVARFVHVFHGPVAAGSVARSCFTAPASMRTRVTDPSPATATSCFAIGFAVAFSERKSSRRTPAISFEATTSTKGSVDADFCAASRSAGIERIVCGGQLSAFSGQRLELEFVRHFSCFRPGAPKGVRGHLRTPGLQLDLDPVDLDCGYSGVDHDNSRCVRDVCRVARRIPHCHRR